VGISDHIDLDKLGHGTTHLFDGKGSDLLEVMVDTMGCGPLQIVTPPEHPEDEVRDQHAFFIRAKMLNGEEVELLFNLDQVQLIQEQTMEVQHGHIQQMFKTLGAPDHIVEGYDQAWKQAVDIRGIIGSISQMGEMVMRVNDVKNDDGTINEDVIDNLTTKEAKAMLNMVLDVLDEDDES